MHNGEDAHVDLYRYAPAGIPSKSDCETKEKWEKVGDFHFNSATSNPTNTIKFDRKIRASQGVDVWFYIVCSEGNYVRYSNDHHGSSRYASDSATDGSLQISTGTPSRGIFSYGDECRFLAGGLHYEIESTISRTGGKMEPGWDSEARGPSIVCNGSTVHTTKPSALDHAEWARGAGHVAPGTVAKWELAFSNERNPARSSDSTPVVFAAGVVAEAARAVDFRTSRGFSLATAPWFFGARDEAGPQFDIETAANCKLNEGYRWHGNVFTFTLDRTGPSGTLSWSHVDVFGKLNSDAVSGIPATGKVFPAACIPAPGQAHPHVKITALEGLIDGTAVQQSTNVVAGKEGTQLVVTGAGIADVNGVYYLDPVLGPHLGYRQRGGIYAITRSIVANCWFITTGKNYQGSKRLYAYGGADPFSRAPVKMKCPCTGADHGGESCDGDPSGKLFPSATRTFGCSTQPVSCKIPFPHKPGADLLVSGWASFAEAYHVHSNPHATDHAPQVALSAITLEPGPTFVPGAWITTDATGTDYHYRNMVVAPSGLLTGEQYFPPPTRSATTYHVRGWISGTHVEWSCVEKEDSPSGSGVTCRGTLSSNGRAISDGTFKGGTFTGKHAEE
jgi:hypothetical protein